MGMTSTARAAFCRKQRLSEHPEALSLETVLHLVEQLEALSEAADVRTLTAAIRQWCDRQRQARVLANTGLVGSLIQKRYVSALHAMGIPLEDAMQEGMIALNKSALLFDESRKVAFSTYATGWIWQAISRLLQTDRLIRIPVYRGRSVNASVPLSLDCCFGPPEQGAGLNFLKDVGREDRQLHQADLRMDLAELLLCLTPLQRQVIELRFFRGLDLAGIGERIRSDKGHAVCKERVRQLIEQALARMREFAARRHRQTRSVCGPQEEEDAREDQWDDQDTEED